MKEPRQRRPLPGLGEVPADLPGIRQFVSRMKEIIELREGRRGVGEAEKVVTFGDLESMGVTKVLSAAPGQKGPVEAAVESTITNQTFVDRFVESLKNTYLFRKLFAAINDVELLKQYPDEVRRELERNMMEVARQRQADIFETQEKIQTATRSLAQRVEWVTASLDKSSSAVRELTFAFSEKDKAMAGKITQVESRLDDVGGVSLEEALETWVSVEAGMYGGYTVKLNMKDANGELIKSAAFGLSVEQPVGGEASSQFIIGADKFAIFTNGGSVMPFGVDANGVYINGSLRISGSSASVASIGRTVELTSTAMAFVTPKNGGADTPSSITLTATQRGFVSPSYKWYVNGSLQAGQTGATLSIASNGLVKVEVYEGSDTSPAAFDVMTIYKVREGDDSLAVGLTNEAHTVACDTNGNPASGALPVTSKLVVARGAAVLTSGVSYSVSTSGCAVSTGAPYNTASTGEFAVTAMSADNATVTVTATVGATTLTKVMTLTKARAGAKGDQGVQGVQGPTGARGSGFGTGSSASDTAFTASTGQAAQDGDQMLVTDALYGSRIFTRQSGAWASTTALQIKGDAVIDGTLAVDKLTSGARTINGTTFRLGAGTYVSSYGTGAAFTAASASIYAAIVSNSAGGALGIGNVGAAAALQVVNSTNDSYSSHYTEAHIASNQNAGYFSNSNGKAIYLATPSYAYQTGGGATGSFTGAHDGLLLRAAQEYPEVGDILIDSVLVRTRDVNDTICENEMSWVPNQKGVVGAFSGFADPWHVPTSLTDENGDPVWNFSFYQQKYRFAIINGIGEGMVNVCGEGGDIEVGDLIVTSSIPGKGMKQADDIVRSITVAKARESVTFASPAEVKQIACIYLCG